MKTEIYKMYEELMVLAHNIEDKLSYDETEEGKKWGLIVNELQKFQFHAEVEEDKISFTYSFLRRKIDWEQFCDLTGIDYYAIRNGYEIKDDEIFYITESKAKQFNLI